MEIAAARDGTFGRGGEERFTGAWLQGREMPLDDAIAYALEEETARIER